jgi:hypothetical protein
MPGDYPDDITMISNLLADNEQIIRTLRKDADRCDDEFHDMSTNDFLIGIMEKHEKMAWILRAYFSCLLDLISRRPNDHHKSHFSFALTNFDTSKSMYFTVT